MRQSVIKVSTYSDNESWSAWLHWELVGHSQVTKHRCLKMSRTSYTETVNPWKSSWNLQRTSKRHSVSYQTEFQSWMKKQCERWDEVTEDLKLLVNERFPDSLKQAEGKPIMQRYLQQLNNALYNVQVKFSPREILITHELLIYVFHWCKTCKIDCSQWFGNYAGTSYLQTFSDEASQHSPHIATTATVMLTTVWA